MEDFEKENNAENDVNAPELEQTENKEGSQTNDTQSNQQQSGAASANSAPDAIADETAGGTRGNKIVKEIISWIVCLAIAFGAAFVIRTWLFTIVKVDGSSMMPTLENGERLFVRIIAYEPERGDIVIFNPKSNPDVVYVKRVIATEGDRIFIDQSSGSVYLKKKGQSDWELLDESYILDEPYSMGNFNCTLDYTDDSGEQGMLIEEGHIFVMGDNRNNSNDSRNYNSVGQVKEDSVIGKVVFRWWPIGKMGTP